MRPIENELLRLAQRSDRPDYNFWDIAYYYRGTFTFCESVNRELSMALMQLNKLLEKLQFSPINYPSLANRDSFDLEYFQEIAGNLRESIHSSSNPDWVNLLDEFLREWLFQINAKGSFGICAELYQEIFLSEKKIFPTEKLKNQIHQFVESYREAGRPESSEEWFYIVCYSLLFWGFFLILYG